MEIVPARRAFTEGIRSVPQLLTYLGIPFIKSRFKRDFWECNEHQLEWLCIDMVKAARLVLAELHPDKGGDATSFRRFKESFDMAKKSFGRKGIGEAPPRRPSKQRTAQEQYIRTREKYREKAAALDPVLKDTILVALRQGFPDTHIAMKHGIDHPIVRVIRETIPPVRCPCGLMLPHPSHCSFRKQYLGLPPIRRPNWAAKIRGKRG